MAENANHELAKEIAVLRSDMNTKQAEYESALDRLRADMANWKVEMAQRENRQLLATIVIVGVAAALLGLLITAQ
ncbi:MAG: hypothetical protein OXI59_01665 [Gemmatimonadota bacterium]|nr:hypothetical protein [Gemmatimonadota bacterium]